MLNALSRLGPVLSRNDFEIEGLPVVQNGLARLGLAMPPLQLTFKRETLTRFLVRWQTGYRALRRRVGEQAAHFEACAIRDGRLDRYNGSRDLVHQLDDL